MVVIATKNVSTKTMKNALIPVSVYNNVKNVRENRRQ